MRRCAGESYRETSGSIIWRRGSLGPGQVRTTRGRVRRSNVLVVGVVRESVYRIAKPAQVDWVGECCVGIEPEGMVG